MNRNPQESQAHDGLVRMMYNHYRNQGCANCKADLPGCPQPDIIQGTQANHRPDVTTSNNGVFVILEAETAQSIFDQHTASQWTLFASAATRQNTQFHVVVPKGYRDQALQRAQQLGIRLDEVWTPQ